MAAAIVIICAGLRAIQEIVVPLLAAGFIAMLAIPLLVVLQRRLGIPRWLSLLLVVLVTIGAVTGLGFLLAQSIAQVQPNLPQYQAQFEAMGVEALDKLRDLGINWTREEAIVHMRDWSIANLAGGILAGFGKLLQSTVLVVLITAFILAEASTLPDKILVAFPAASGSGGLRGVADKVRTYLMVVTQLNILMGIMTYIACLALGMEFALLLAFVVFFLNYIPTIGAIVGGAIPVVFAMVTKGWGPGVAMGCVQLGLGVVVGSVIQPRMLGSRLGLSPLVVLLSLVVWGYLLGTIGMFFAVPLTIIVKIILDSTDDLRWMGVLLGDGRSAQAATQGKTPVPAAGQLVRDIPPPGPKSV
jgi:predicted PurR-regulated permease PerM